MLETGKRSPFSPFSKPGLASSQQNPGVCPELPLFTRYSGNPILSRQNWPYAINSVFNAGAVRLPDGDTLLLCRVEDRSTSSMLKGCAR
jgi:hypothetical protein